MYLNSETERLYFRNKALEEQMFLCGRYFCMFTFYGASKDPESMFKKLEVHHCDSLANSANNHLLNSLVLAQQPHTVLHQMAPDPADVFAETVRQATIAFTEKYEEAIDLYGFSFAANWSRILVSRNLISQSFVDSKLHPNYTFIQGN